MKTSILCTVVIAVFSLSLISFSPRPGAHSFQVFVDNKLVVERYASADMKPLTITIPSPDSRIDVHYSECGRLVSGRKLTIKDENGRVLKTWDFAGTASGLEEAMTLRAKDLATFDGYRGVGLKVVYSSNDFQEGIHVFTVASGSATLGLN
jgi:hypothetical protein